jgi:hypothetical protein
LWSKWGTGIIIITTGIAGIAIITGTVITDRYGPVSSL